MKKPSSCIASLLLMIGMGWGLATGQTPNSPKTDTVVVKMDAALDAIVPADAKLEMLPADGFEGGEGPVWVQQGKAGYLLFSDIPGNRIYKWTPGCFRYPCPVAGKLSVYLEHAGYQDASHTGAVDSKGTRLNGTNGLTLDRQHRIPPNGIALSPDEKILYVTNGGPAPNQRKIFAYDVQSDGTVKNRRVLVDLTGEKGLGGPDGVKVDRQGNVYTAATGGVWIASPGGKRLGLIRAPEGLRFANLAFGDPDSKTLYLVTGKNLWRIRLNVPGVRP